MSRLFCFGLGYTARALARPLRTAGWHVAGTARTEDGAASLRGQGFEAFVFDGDRGDAGIADALASATHVLTSAPPDEQGDAVLRVYGSQLCDAADLAWAGYLSTVGVYGNTFGGWVDEASDVSGDFDRTRWRIAAERDWLTRLAARGRQAQIFRLAGIYGPGRSAFDGLRSGRAQRIIKPGQVFNRIHVDDIARVLAAAMTGRGMHDIYNVADDEPAPPQDVITYAAELIGVAPPPEIAFEDAKLSPMAQSFYESNRRVSNARLKGDLGVALRYPTYREGLRGILATG
ncbi:MAG: SDR family oxidoreductase [Hyphomicrobiaceae bacterium]|nr:SDR family oxidoreductase [Hyphomicrobiaceae bacterium]